MTSRRWRWAPVVVVILQAVLWLVAGWPRTAAARSPIEAPSSLQPLATRPGAEGAPTIVHLSVYIINVTAIDERDQTFTGDLYLSFRWLDGRLADPSLQRAREAPLDRVWHPRLLPVNRSKAEFAYPQVVEIDPAGEVLYTQRLVGSFSVPLRFREFPFDRHDLYLEIVSPGYSSGEIAFAVDADRVGREPEWALPGWRTSPVTARPFTKEVAFAAPNPGIVQLSGVRVEFSAARNWHYYLLREVLPLLFIALMSSSLFWIPPTADSIRVGISTAAIFSLMAYYVQLGRALPRIDYLTRMDWLVIGATILVFASFTQVILVMYLVKSDRLPKVRRIERWSRVVYPLALFGVVVVAFG